MPSRFKMAVVTPLIKKEGLVVDDLMNFRQISNVSLVSKMLERLVCQRKNIHLQNIGTLPPVQSAYRRCYSTETAMTKVMSDIIMAADAGNVTLLPLLDLSAAFDTVDHAILLQRLHTTHCVTGKVLDWLRSYLFRRYQSVQFAEETSAPVLVLHGVPKSSVLGPLLFITYTSDIPGIITSEGLLCMCYADDTQLANPIS